jgi:hypothetical protein
MLTVALQRMSGAARRLNPVKTETGMNLCSKACLPLLLLAPSLACPLSAQVLFEEDFEQDLAAWSFPHG